MKQLSRRQFLGLSAAGLAGGTLPAQVLAAGAPANDDIVSFFLIGDTHYLANRDQAKQLTATSRLLTTRLVDWLNRLPGTAISEKAGGGKVATPRGLIHAGDLIDSGDRTGKNFVRMQETELAAYVADFGLTGKDGRLRFPVYEVHGNHDAPQGDGLVPGAIRTRNKNRPGLMNVSANGLHYSWDWGGIHFLCLGIVVGAVAETARRRRYHPQDSLAFLVADLNRHVGESNRPVIITHHVDVARYSLPCDPKAPAGNHEWDPCDVRAYYQALRNYNVIGICYGHTHARRLFHWDGTRTAAKTGIPIFNTDKASHFQHVNQAILYFEVGRKEMIVREFGTRDRWQTAQWTPQTWRFPVQRG